MNITADTNLLVRASTGDDPDQARSARSLLDAADRIVIPPAVFCEFAWVLGRAYRYTNVQIGTAIRRYVDAASVVTDRPSVQAGLKLLAAGGDFVDGVIAEQGRADGGTIFASFDRTALKLLTKFGYEIHYPS